ncbi:NNMT/PNMT/TEMT family class I SAM-dependent methyltransferase [Aurantimonas sp. VKM B-3413]|uniref:NNMT/PNMT/TEMT family class I SAM-dependent methyltransferase n=1 Tax=Aurantimonas sp. VKM B-3413 TaxID=2779401 RepID=UPI001E302177|nr:NNMT/PNMT/TEMT family class I SAM-dependent methyltransferase [Aurantimonas sp. VKM B-3413]MCB8836998.1 NNMT/PNMT/TEMT family class I SAM-dependent methyltransferase [Aurantimonas sp. VKM B-3413]
MPDEKLNRRNADFSWSEFDSEYYFQHYYGEPHRDDEDLVRFTCSAFKELMDKDQLLDILDVGTGPSLIPLMCASPLASKVTAWEYSESNIRWLRHELASAVPRPQWDHFWAVARATYAPEYRLPENPLESLRGRTEIRHGSIFDLPKRSWDAATMFFCAESITGSRDEFRRACSHFAQAVKQDGLLVAAFLVGSSRYEVADRPFPILNVSDADIREVFEPLAADIQATTIGIVEEEIRSGYSGMLFMTARST